MVLVKHKWYDVHVAQMNTHLQLSLEEAICTREQNETSSIVFHDDGIKWKHFPRHWPFVRGIHRSPVNSPHKGQWRGALRFSLICTRINGWLNNREVGYLRRHRAHYDVIVMLQKYQYTYFCHHNCAVKHWQNTIEFNRHLPPGWVLCPVNRRSYNNVSMTSKGRFDVIITFCYFMCLPVFHSYDDCVIIVVLYYCIFRCVTATFKTNLNSI